MPREYVILDLLPHNGEHHLWSGDHRQSLDSMLPAGTHIYEPMQHVALAPLQAALGQRVPSLRLSLALAEDDTLSTALRASRARWPCVMRLAADISQAPTLVPSVVFAGDVVKSELVEGLWNLDVKHFLSRLDSRTPEPAMADLAHQRFAAGDQGFGHMAQTHAFLARWPNR